MRVARLSRFISAAAISAPLLAGGALLSACSASGPTTSTSARALATCEIVSPSVARPLDVSDDLDPATPDIQANVQLRVRGAAGATVALELDGRAIGTAQAAGGDDSMHLFSNVTFKEGVARVGCRMSGAASGHAERSFAVYAACAMRFARPSMGERLSAAELRIDDAGRMVHSVVVETKGIPAGTAIELLRTQDGTAIAIAQAALQGSAVRFDVPAEVGETRLQVRSVGTACAAASDVAFEVGPSECTARLTLPAVLNAAADASPAPGLQTRLCADTVCPNGATVTMLIDGGGEVTGVVRDGRACVDATLPEGRASILTRVEGSRGTVVVPPARPCVDVTPPRVSVTSELAGLVLRTRDDAVPTTTGTMELPIRGVVTGLRDSSCGLTAAPRVEIRVNNEVQHSFGEDGRDQSFDRVARLLPGRNVVQVCATDAAQNVSCSPASEVNVRLQHPTLRFERGEREWVLGQGPVAGQRDFDVNLDGLELAAGTMVRLSAGAGGWSCTQPLRANGAVTFAVGRDCASLPDGTHHLSAIAVDSDGNVAESPELVIHLDTLPPTLRFLTLGGNRALVEGLATNEARSDLSLEIDGADGQAAALFVNGLQVATSMVSSGRARFSEVVLAEGANELVVEARDAAGNLGSTRVRVLRDTVVPVPRIAGLAAGRVFGPADDLDGNASNGAQVDLHILTPGEADGTVVTLQVGGMSPLRATSRDGTTTFSRVTLPEGDATVSVTARDAAGNVGVQRVAVSVRLGQPMVRVVSPADGAVLGASADVDAAAPGLQVAVAVSIEESPTVSACHLIVDAGSAAEQRRALTLEGKVCRGTLTLAEGPHTFTAEVDAQGITRSQPIRVRADVTAPRLRITAPSSMNLVANPAGGLQTRGDPIVVTADDVEPGQLAVLRVTSDGQQVAIRYAAFDGAGQATFAGVQLGAPGMVSLEVQVADQAGNLSAIANATVGVVLAP